jgi:hypothetical protein
MDEVKATVAEFELPCGHLEGDKVFDRVVIREMTGVEEDILAERNGSFISRMNQVIANCIIRIFGDEGSIEDRGRMVEIVRNLSVGDRVVLMFLLRRVSIGDNFDFKIRCGNCNKELAMTVNLGDLKIKKSSDPRKRLFDLVLPSGKKVKCRIMTGVGEEAVDKIRNSGGDILTAGIFIRIAEIDGKPPLMDEVKRLSLKDRNAIRKETGKIEGSIETSVSVKCNECGNDFETGIDVTQAGFFFPAET